MNISNSSDEAILGRPTIRKWELDETSSRYDRMRAAPSDAKLHIMWTAWSASFFVASIFNLVVFLAVLMKRETRKRPFNLYLLYIMLPDILFTLFCAVQCANLSFNNGYTSSTQCLFQSFYLVWGIAANSWLNGVVSWEVYVLLRDCFHRRRAFPPTSRKIALQAGVVYVWSAIIALFGLIGRVTPVDGSWYPQTDSMHGLVCLPMEFDRTSTVFFWTIFYPFLNLIPILFGVAVLVHVVKSGWLPRSGKTREIAVFFFRLIVVFVAMWLPGIIFLYLASNANMWVVYVSGIWPHFQGAVAAAMSMLKLDIRTAVIDFITGQTWRKNRLFLESQSTRSYRFSSGVSQLSMQLDLSIGSEEMGNAE